MASIGLSKYSVEELLINLDLNIASSSDNKVRLTRDMLVLSLDEEPIDKNIQLNNYPYITLDVRYPIDELRALPYNDRVIFFFNKNRFIETLERVPDSIIDSSYNTNKSNVMHMLELLFPTKFPVINDVHKSSDIVNNKISTRPFIFNPLATRMFSYLKVNGKEYTIKKSIWLNDVLNHPLYSELIKQYIRFRRWADNENVNNPTNKDRIDQYFEKTYTKNKELGELPIEYNQFAFTTMNKYRRPIRTSSNVELQRMIDGKNDKNTKEFFAFMENIYNTFIEPDSNSTYNKSFINVGINQINIGNDNKPTREIYVMIDLIEGKITDETVSRVFCPYIGDHIGNKIKILLQPSPLSKWWSVNQGRNMFSIADTVDSNEQIEVSAKPILPIRENSNDSNVDTTLKNKFDTEILSVNNELSSKIDNIIKTYPSLLATTDINDMYKFLNTYKLYQAPDMGDVIRKWATTDAKDTELINKIITEISTIDGLKNINSNKLEPSETKILVPEEVEKIRLDNELYDLYKMVLAEIRKSEDKKPLAPAHMMGGKRRRSRKANKKTKRNTRKRTKK